MTAPENPEIGPIGDRVLYEDEHVRIWDMVLEPGQRSPLHHHENDYVVVVVEGDHEPAEASEERSGAGYGSVEVTPGESVFLHKGATEVAINSGARRYRDIQVELLG